MNARLANANWNLIPEHMRGAVERWIEHGIAPGSFLTAVICNDLRGALGKADDINRHRLHDYASFFHMDAPSGCWGSPEKFAEWEESGGLVGQENAAEDAWMRSQERLMESGGPDDSAYRANMIAAGRGHLLR